MLLLNEVIGFYIAIVLNQIIIISENLLSYLFPLNFRLMLDV